MIAPNHNSEGNNLKPIYMSVTAWIEVLSVAIDIVLHHNQTLEPLE